MPVKIIDIITYIIITYAMMPFYFAQYECSYTTYLLTHITNRCHLCFRFHF